jgi:hypothetical protein
MGRSSRVVGAALVATLLVFSGIMVGCSSPTEPSDVTPTPPVATPPTTPNPPSTPTVSLSGLSPEVRNLVKTYNIDSYGSSRFVAGWPQGQPIRVYVDPGFRREDAVAAMNYWEQRLSRKVSLQIVESQAEASAFFDFVPSITGPAVSSGTCGIASLQDIVNGVIRTGYAHYVFGQKPECMYRGYDVVAIAHEMGHLLGYSGHSECGSDVMSKPYPGTLVTCDENLTAAMNWTSSVPPGSVVQ